MPFYIDGLNQQIQAMNDGGVDVRVVLDSFTLPSIENEAACLDCTCDPGQTTGFDAYDHQWVGFSCGEAGETFFYNEATAADMFLYSNHALRVATWQAPGEPSCEDAHAGGLMVECGSLAHVVMNHVSTPMFIKQDLGDRVIPGATGNSTPGNFNHRLPWAECYPSPACGDAEVDYQYRENEAPCLLNGTRDYQNRLFVQTDTMFEWFYTRSELATGEDETFGPNPVPSDLPSPTYGFFPDCGESPTAVNHQGVYDDGYFNVSLDPDGSGGAAPATTYKQFIEEWANADREWEPNAPTGVAELLMSEWGTSTNSCPGSNQCPP